MGSIIFHAVIFALLSLIFIAAGLRVLIAKRPFIASRRWQAIVIILGLTPSFANAFEIMWPKYPGENLLFVFLQAGFYTMICVVILLRLRGCLVFGVSRTALRDTLRQTFSRLNLPYEESDRTYHLLTLNNELLVEATSIDDGVFLLRLKKSDDRSTFRRVASEISDFFRTASVQIKRRGSYALVVLGGVILIAGSCLTYIRLSIRAEQQALRKANPEYFKSSEK
ncbi:MAG TPA: hypothetical protein VJ810_04645 [Blastocatellia bacterium]|nr:hypothetical protein [Blastocatellia bacterium]